MKKLLIIYNVIFLIVGNILFSNIHYLNHHSHDHSHHHSHDHDHNSVKEECLDCIVFDTNKNCVSEVNEVTFSNKNFSQYKIQYFTNPIEFDVEKRFLSRAPPISK